MLAAAVALGHPSAAQDVAPGAISSVPAEESLRRERLDTARAWRDALSVRFDGAATLHTLLNAGPVADFGARLDESEAGLAARELYIALFADEDALAAQDDAAARAAAQARIDRTVDRLRTGLQDLDGVIARLSAAGMLTSDDILAASDEAAAIVERANGAGPDQAQFVAGRADATVDFPAVAMMGQTEPATGQVRPWCTGTLIGRRTVVTARHCICGALGAQDCAAAYGPDFAPERFRMFFQFAGKIEIKRFRVFAEDVPGLTTGDMAVAELARDVEIVRPAPRGEGAGGTFADIVGFGQRSPGFGTPSAPAAGGPGLRGGIKARALVQLGDCPASKPGLVCWSFDASQVRRPDVGTTCFGDSGGPVLVDGGAGDRVLRATVVGGQGRACTTGALSVNADIAQPGYANWLAERLTEFGDAPANPGALLPPLGDVPGVLPFYRPVVYGKLTAGAGAAAGGTRLTVTVRPEQAATFRRFAVSVNATEPVSLRITQRRPNDAPSQRTSRLDWMHFVQVSRARGRPLNGEWAVEISGPANTEFQAVILGLP